MRFSYETERIPYYVTGHYIPDFRIVTPTGILFIETKGYLRPEDKRKLIAVRRCNPQMDIRLLFYEKRKSQIKWAERVGFKYAIETIPTEWLKGL